jgi:hypothetical protein
MLAVISQRENCRTTPSTLTYTATVQKIHGGWALLSLSSGADAKPNWYYVPYMPGAWEPQ